ncbi:MAG: hypothetical protein Q9183_002452 [Haloplaca sp. 2 TL-2023]
MVMPSIPASSSSKSTSKAVQSHGSSTKVAQYDSLPPAPELDAVAEKENMVPNHSLKAASQHLPCPPSSSQRSQQKECPQTPLGRLPLSELIAAVDENANQNLNLTPVERVLWHHTPSFSSSQDPPSRQKGKKRARSSSPVSSSQNDTINHFQANGQSFNLQTLQKNLKTPKADPADDLWTRYSLKTGRAADGSPTRNNNLLAELLRSSSPTTPGSHLKTRSLGGLRRAISCANEWPKSATKRRRLNPSSSQNYALEDHTVNQKPEDPRISRVNLLVQEVQNSLLKNRTETPKAQDAATTSSSSPHAASSPVQSQASSPRTVVRDNEDVQQHIDPDFFSSGIELGDGHLDEQNAITEKASDFGDDDFDDDLMEAVNVALVSGMPAGNRGTASTPRPVISDSTENVSVRTSATAPQCCASSLRQEAPRCLSKVELNPTNVPTAMDPGMQDEFDDDGDDILAADFEDLAAMYDQSAPDPQQLQNLNKDTRRPSPHKQKRSPRKSPSKPAGQVGAQALVSARGQCDHDHVIDVSSDDEFGEGLDFDDLAECTAADQLPSQTLSILVVQPEKSKENKLIVLRQSWISSPCSVGSHVHLIGSFDKLGQCHVDDKRNMLILHPDHLVSATVVGDSFSCTRRAVLQDRVKATNKSGEAQVYGHMLHEIFQEAIKVNRWDDEGIHKTIETVVSRYLEPLFEINIDPLRAIDQLKGKAIPLQAWARTFVSATPKAEATIRERNGTTSNISVNKLLEVEEKVWSPMYGLKGNVDATVEIQTQTKSDIQSLLVPFELKTGKHANASHKAQTALYTLLLSDRYDIDVVCGILYYTESSEMSRVPAVRHELIHMVMQRNALAMYIRQKVHLPPMLKSPHLCGQCYAQTPCFIYHRLVEDGNGETSGLKDKFDEVIRHLNPAHATFFRKWDDLLTKEEKDIVKVRRELWTMQSAEREKLGRCFSNVVIEPGSTMEVQDAPKINRYHYAFVKEKHVSGFSFLESQITVGEPIVISDEKGHFALANGYVTGIRKRRVEVAVDRRLNKARTRRQDFQAQDNQSFVGIMEVLEEGSASVTRRPEEPQELTSYRIDKDEFSNGMATVRNNMISLMDKTVFGSQPLRRLIVENAAPTFREGPSSYSLGDSVSQESLNVDQRNAIGKVLSAKDYALVLGMPGTGKTTTIAHIIRALTAQGKSVLLTSYTHTAVDNILLKVRHDNIGVFRLGAVAKVHPDVQDFADLAGVPMKSIEEIQRAYSRPVVATTCLGVNHPIFNQKIFDYCIVDEASQITLPVCLGPIRMARTFILVGDHNQLPPLVQNKEAQEGGLDVSLFKMLSDNHPSSVVNLEHQYRMCEDVMSLSNTLIYNERLKCGNREVARRTVRIPRMEALKQHHHTPSTLLSAHLNPKAVCLNPVVALCWIRDLLDPSVKACFVNTDSLLPQSRETETGSRIVNTCEATLCTQLVQALLTTGIPAADIGLITLYRSQLALLKQNLRHQHPSVEMHTADKFQGRDKEAVILSLVRSNESLNVGDLLKDWRRVNVALTRARTKLLIVGSKSTMKGNELLAKFAKFMDQRHWVYDLPRGATEGHVFDDGATPLTAMMGSPTKASKVETKTSRKSPKKAKRIDGFFERGKGKHAAKVGKVTEGALLGRRPVLRDIINDAA